MRRCCPSDSGGAVSASELGLPPILRREPERFEQLAHASRVSTMGELTASLAHELEQPLTAILSYAQAAEHFLAEEHLAGDATRRGERIVRPWRDAF